MRRFSNFNWPLAGFTFLCGALSSAGYISAMMPGVPPLARVFCMVVAVASTAFLSSTLTRLRYTFRRYPMWRSIADSINKQMDESGHSSGKVEIMLRVTGDAQQGDGQGEAGQWVN